MQTISSKSIDFASKVIYVISCPTQIQSKTNPYDAL